MPDAAKQSPGDRQSRNRGSKSERNLSLPSVKWLGGDIAEVQAEVSLVSSAATTVGEFFEQVQSVWSGKAKTLG